MSDPIHPRPITPPSPEFVIDQIKKADPNLIAQGVAQKSGTEREVTAARVLAEMPADEARKAAAGNLPTPPPKIWYLIIGGLFVLSLLFGILSYDLLRSERDAAAVIGLATGALGGVIGLLTPGPISRE